MMAIDESSHSCTFKYTRCTLSAVHELVQRWGGVLQICLTFWLSKFTNTNIFFKYGNVLHSSKIVYAVLLAGRRLLKRDSGWWWTCQSKIFANLNENGIDLTMCTLKEYFIIISKAALFSFLQKDIYRYYWIGLTDLADEGTFVWQTDYEEATYTY